MNKFVMQAAITVIVVLACLALEAALSPAAMALGFNVSFTNFRNGGGSVTGIVRGLTDWYFVKIDQSETEDWINSDFINPAGRATPLPQMASQSSTCEGLMEAMTFTAFYDDSGFHLVRFVNLETQNTFDGSLSRQGSNNQGQPLYQGTMSPPTGGSYPVELIDLSGGNPRSGSQVAINYVGIEGTGTCR
jgi:hypothetical protein